MFFTQHEDNFSYFTLLCSAPGASLPHSGQGRGTDLVDTLGVFQPGKVHLLHVTAAASTSAA